MRASARKLGRTGANVLYGRTVHPLPLRVAISGVSHIVGMTAAGLPLVEEYLHHRIRVISTIVTMMTSIV